MSDPMTGNGGDMQEQLELFVDGLLQGEQLRAFEAELERSPELRDQVELQSQIDSSLTRSFPATDVQLPTVAGAISDASKVSEPKQSRHLPDSSPQRNWVKPALMAASVLVAGAIGAYFLFFSTQRAEFDQPGEVYASIVNAGFVPREVCTTEAQFIEWMERKFDQALVVPPDAEGIELVGWDYRRIMTPRTGVLLARVDGQEVLVLVELRDKAVRLGDQSEQELRVFRRNIGRVSLYEVTPLDEPRILPLASVPK